MLVTNGCSFVWGDELEGYDNNPPTHHHLTFTHKLADLLDVPYENLSRCGNGNDKIFRDTIIRLNATDKPTPTHMVILWSAWQREEYANRMDRKKYRKSAAEVEDCMVQYSEERTVYADEAHWGPLTKYYNEFYDERTSIIHHLSYMISMQTLCDSMGIKLIQGAFHRRMIDNLSYVLSEDYSKWEEYNSKIGEMLSMLRSTSKIGLGHWTDLYSLAQSGEGFHVKPNSHPCEGTHHEYAKLLHHIFTKVIE